MFTFDQVQTFIAIVDAGSLSRAAKKLGKTKGAVSIMLGNFEDELGILLFDRSGWQLQVTEVGRQIYQQSQIWQHQALNMQAIGLAHKKEIESVLRIGIQKIIPALELHQNLENFRHTHQHTELQLVRGGDAQLEQQLHDGEIDLLIRVLKAPRVPFGLEFTNAGSMEMIFACAPDHSLVDLPVVDNIHLLSTKQVLLDLGDEGTNQQQKISYDSMLASTIEDFLYQVEVGVGWCVLPKSLYAEREALGTLIRLKPRSEGDNATIMMLEAIISLERLQGPGLLKLKQCFLSG